MSRVSIEMKLILESTLYDTHTLKKVADEQINILCVEFKNKNISPYLHKCEIKEEF